MYVVIVRFICDGLTRKSFAMEFNAGKYMFADNGEKEDARAAARIISRFWVVVKTEYCWLGVDRSGVDSVGELTSLRPG